jgi:secondary thiamine-phosphate synthase enzyme
MLSPLSVRTEARIQAVDVTSQVANRLRDAAASGWVMLNVPHTTAAIVITEADPDLLRDLEKTAQGLLAPLEPFTHHKNGNPNASAHLLSAFLGTQALVSCHNGQIQLGTYQRLVLLELDGPKERQIAITLLTGRLP